MAADTKTLPTLPTIEQICKLAPGEILSDDSLATLFGHFEADRDLGWDRTNLTAELVEHPRRALKWAMLAAAAERYAADLELAAKDLRARIDARTRQAFTSAAVKFTEAMVAASIDSDPQYQESQRALHGVHAKARILADVRELFRHRKDLLIQEALQLRMEGGADPCVSLDIRRRQAALADLERRGMTLAEAVSMGAGSADGRPDRTPVR